MHINTTASTVVILVLFGLLVSGCAHTDSAAWDRVDTMLRDARERGGHVDTDKAAAVKAWGEPVVRESTEAGEKMLWLLTADITAPSSNRETGWEAILIFDAEGTLLDRRWGYYRTPVGIPEIIAATRKDPYHVVRELGLAYEQHALAGEEKRLTVNLSDRGRKLYALHWAAEEIRLAIIFADGLFLIDKMTAEGRRNSDKSVVATELEVIQYMVQNNRVLPAYIMATQPFPLVVLAATIEKQNPMPTWSNVLLNALAAGLASGGSSRPQAGFSNMGPSFSGGTLGSGFMGPYRPNAYGPGINSDSTGRAFIWKPDSGGPALGPIHPNAYRPGIGSDGTGRAVRPCQWPCQ